MFKGYPVAFVMLGSSVLLSACGGGGGSEQIVDDPQISPTVTTHISGSVGDGPVLGADIKVYDATGSVVETQTSDANAAYALTVTLADDRYPLTLEATGGIDLVTQTVPDIDFLAVLTHGGATDQTANLNPYSSLITRITQHQADIDDPALAAARQTVLNTLNFGLDSNAMPDPMLSIVDDNNVHIIVKASEALGEMLRRTRDTLNADGQNITADAITAALAADLSDGRLDGVGADGSDPKITALASLIGGQVSLEALRNELKVNGAIATAQLDAAIAQTHPNAAVTTSDAPITAELIQQAQRAIQAASAIQPSAALDQVLADLNALEPNGLATDVGNLLDSDAALALTDTVNLAAAASGSALTDIVDAIAIAWHSPPNPFPAVNRPPSIEGMPVTNVAENTPYSFIPSASDPDGDALSFTGTHIPSWLTFDPQTGGLSGQPGFADAGNYSTITITVSDGQANASLIFDITVGDSNQPPTLSGNPFSILEENLPFEFTPTANDADGDALTFSATNLPTWLTVDPITGTLTGTPDFDAAGSYDDITLAVSDGQASAAMSFDLIVLNLNRTPILSGTALTEIGEMQPYVFIPNAFDPDSDPLLFSVENLPHWADFDTANGAINGTPGFDDAGDYPDITIVARDSQDSAQLSFTLTVTNVNRTPTIGGTPASAVQESESYQFTPAAADPDGDPLTFSINNLPAWLDFAADTGTLTGVPSFADAGVYPDITITVSDGQASASLVFALTVGDFNRPPAIGGAPAATVLENQAYLFTPDASDADNDTLSFAALNLPAWLKLDNATGTLSGTPGYEDAGNYTAITLSVSDGQTSASLSFDLTVLDVNRPPTIGGTPPATVAEEQNYSFTPNATDADGDTLNFSATNLPAWLNLNSSTGALNGTPDYEDAGSYNDITLTVSDGRDSASLSFDLTVDNSNRAPTISGVPPASVEENQSYSFTPTLDDADNDPLTVSVANLPTWLSFDATTGAMSGVADFDSAGTYSGITLTVNDGQASASISFDLTVTNVNQAPTLNNTPTTSVVENQRFAFNPLGSDPDGDTLAYSFENIPTWMKTGSTSGVLVGTPDYGDAGTYKDITVHASDGDATASLKFDLSVTDNNQPPTIDGTPPATVTEMENYTFTPQIDDADGHELTVTATNLPDWLNLDSATGAINGVPGFNHAGLYTGITLTVSDGIETASLVFDITVENLNQVPTLSGQPLTSVNENQFYSFTPAATDPDNDPLTFSIANAPAWLSFAQDSGALFGTPQAGDVGFYSNIAITVSDGMDSDTLSFDLAVCALGDCVPDVLYTDVLSGPLSGGENDTGAYLSLFGVNFGDSGALGTSTQVFINDVEVAEYLDLGPARAQVLPQRTIQRLSVRVGALGNPPRGEPLPIRIVVDGVSSEADHSFIAQPGNILYVDNVNGNDATAEINNPDKPFRYVQAADGILTGAFGQAQPGDFIVMRGNAPWTDVGSADRFMRVRYTSGSEPTGIAGTGPITLMGHPSEDVLIECQDNTACGIHGVDGYSNPGEGLWVTIANLRIRGGNATVYDGPINLQHKSDYWRVVNTELFDWDAQPEDVYDGDGTQIAWEARAGGITGDGVGIKLLGNHIHGIGGGTLNHGMYIDGGAQDIEIAYNHLENLTGGNIIQLYDSIGLAEGASHIVDANIHHNLMHDGNRYGLNFSSGTASVRAWNNIVYNTTLAGLRFSTTAGSGSGYEGGIQVVHNTFYNVATEPASNWGAAIDNDWTGDGIVIMNNIVSPSPSANGYYANTANHENLVLENNLYVSHSGAPPEKDSFAIEGEANFTDAIGHDFHLLTGSAAIDNGATLVLPVVNDFDDHGRDDKPDIGAYEFGQ